VSNDNPKAVDPDVVEGEELELVPDADFVPDGEAVGEGVEAPLDGAPECAEDSDRVSALEALVSERTADLQRLQAEYVNYRKRVERDRALAKQAGIEQVVSELLPVLDSIEMARSHDELTGGFKLVADELTKVAAKYGLESYGAKGDPFDPQIHEALMQMPMAGITVTTCAEVMQVGYKLHDRVLRPARVAVAEPGADDATA
jgi:molecular chaperone GrpE